MTQFKKVLSVLALAAMAGFILAILTMIFTGYSELHGRVIYGCLTAFLVLGLTALLINYLQKRAAEKAAIAQQEENTEENN